MFSGVLILILKLLPTTVVLYMWGLGPTVTVTIAIWFTYIGDKRKLRK